MGETAQILTLWRRSREQGDRVCLATVVHVEGSSYRKPGARMLITSSGSRAGTISGGCLEAEVSRKAWWLTANGPVVERYQSSFDEDGGGWGLGCGGSIWVLVEQEPLQVLEALEQNYLDGEPKVIITQLSAPSRTLDVLRTSLASPANVNGMVVDAAARVYQYRQSLFLGMEGEVLPPGSPAIPTYFLEYLAPPPRLTVFGAGDDAQPIAEFAEALGWRVTVADGRSHLLRRERFHRNVDLRLLQYTGAGAGPMVSPVACGLNEAGLADTARAGSETATLPLRATGTTDPGVQPGELAVLLTHSFEQDRALLETLLPLPLAYLGILGPRHRTQRLLDEVAPALGWTVEACFARLHSPVGLDLGGRDPAAIALAIVAELQAVVAGRTVSVARQPGRLLA